MTSCKGLHCEGCGHGGGPAAAIVALVVIVALALRKAWPAIMSALEIAAWTLAAVTGATIAVTCTVLAVRAVRKHRARRAVAYRPGVVIPAARVVERPIGPAAGRAALGQPRRSQPGPWPLPGHREQIGYPGRDGNDGSR